MPTKKNETASNGGAEGFVSLSSRHYEVAIEQYGSALELLRKGSFEAARDLFHEIRKNNANEPELAERAATYARICEQKLSPPATNPDSLDEYYRRAVVLTNEGQWDPAIELLNQALSQDPLSVNCLYVRACAWALKGAVDRAVADLREAIAIDPKVRFQAVNDPDFEGIREEPSFIDIIEPTPTGA